MSHRFRPGAGLGEGALVFRDGRPIGFVSSIAWSPTLGKTIGLAEFLRSGKRKAEALMATEHLPRLAALAPALPIASGNLLIADCTDVSRFGLRGKGSCEWLKSNGIAVPDRVNVAAIDADGMLVLHLGQNDIAISGNGRGPSGVDAISAAWRDAEGAKGYDGFRRDTWAHLVVSGSDAAGLMAELTDVDLRDKNRPRYRSRRRACFMSTRSSCGPIRPAFRAMSCFSTLRRTPSCWRTFATWRTASRSDFKEMSMTAYVLTVQCESRRGIVAAVTTFLAQNGCNITDAAQFDDERTGRFFARITFRSETGKGEDELRDGFAHVAREQDMVWDIRTRDHRPKVLLMVSNFGHCLNDLLYRWRIGALPIDIVGVVSNHFTYQKLVVNHDLPFHHIRVTKENKAQAERQLMQVIDDAGVELVVLARYMQVLSDEVCERMSGRIINIHHSFLPSFKGANPYKQAFERGVKLIGATAHYVTADLDEGPIIEQDTVRISHAQSPEDYISLGRDVEAQVLARAIHAHVHHRVFINGEKTVVFPASPGSYASERMG